jgi:putative membrane protein
MNLIIRILLTAVLVMIISHFMPGIALQGSHGLSTGNFMTAIWVAIVLGLLNLFVKPLLDLLTLPVTFITLGLFLLVVNALIILLCAKLVSGFVVDGFLTALLFSLILSISQSIVFSLTGGNK